MFRLTDHINRLFNSGQDLMMDIPYRREELVEAGQADRGRATASPSATSGRSLYSATGRWASTPCLAGQRGHRRLAVGRLPRRGSGHKGVRMKVSSWQRHDPNTMPPAAKGTGHVHQLLPGQGRGAEGRLRRGGPARPRRATSASARARTSSSCAATASSPRRRRRRAGRHHADSVHHYRQGPRLSRCATRTSRAPTSTSPTRRS